MFALLLHFYVQGKLTCQMFMEGTNAKRTSVHIAATAMKHQAVIPHLLAAHALSGCDSVAYMYGIGKCYYSQSSAHGCLKNDC